MTWPAPAARHQDGKAEEIQRWRAFALWRLGSLGLDAEYGDAQPFYSQCLAFYQGLNDNRGTANVLAAWRQTEGHSQPFDQKSGASGQGKATML